MHISYYYFYLKFTEMREDICIFHDTNTPFYSAGGAQLIQTSILENVNNNWNTNRDKVVPSIQADQP